jgi:hypothetical protein
MSEPTPVGYIQFPPAGQVIEGRPANEVGVVQFGHPDTEANRRSARKTLIEVDAADFDVLDSDSTTWIDRATGNAFEKLGSDPLFAPNPSELADLFTSVGGSMVFLRRRPGVTLDTLAAERERQDRGVDPVEAPQLTGHPPEVWARHDARSFGKAQRDEARALMLDHGFGAIDDADDTATADTAKVS